MAGLLRGYVGGGGVVGVVVVVVVMAVGCGEGGIGRCGAAAAAEGGGVGGGGGVNHVVGGDKGWDAAADVAAWSIDKVFRVGDSIWFTYSAAREEGIMELGSRQEFESCDLRNPIKTYAGGLDRVSLDAAGGRYFASGRPENCRNGLKLHVQVEPQVEAGGERTAEEVEQQQQQQQLLLMGAEELASGPAPSGSGRAAASPLILVGLVVLRAVAL